MSVCRVCLSTEPDKDISQLKTTKKEGNKSPFEIMKFCLCIEVNEDSNITNKLCSKCFQKILTFYKFKALALRSDASLRSLTSDVRIKLEPIHAEYEDSAQTVDEDPDCLYEFKLQSDGLESEDEYLISVKKFKLEQLSEDEDFEFEIGSGQNNDVTELVKAENEHEVEELKEEPENVMSKIPARPKKRKRVRHKTSNVEGEKSEICEECGKTVKNVKEHAMSHLPKQMKKKFPCKDPDCSKSFCSLSARTTHYRRKHLGIKKHCDICNKDVVCLNQHIMQVHEPERMPHPCLLCDRRFISQSALDEHITIHTKDQPHACEHCGKTFRLAVTMKNHIRSVHHNERPHMCQYCSKSFFKKYHMQNHLRSHTKEKPYQCKECGKSFGNSKNLKCHIETHSKVRNFQCTQCSMSFARIVYLRTHMISHTKIKKHPCKYCGVKFGRSDHRKRHEFTAHEKNMLAGTNGGKKGDENNMAAVQVSGENVDESFSNDDTKLLTSDISSVEASTPSQ